MQTTSYLLILILAAALFFQPLVAKVKAEAAPSSTQTGASAKLRQLFAAEWDYEMEHDPTRASSLGDRRWNDRWPDVSLEAIARRHEHDKEVLARLSAINRAELSAADQLNYDLFQKEYESRIEENQYHWYLVPVNQRGGIQTANELA